MDSEFNSMEDLAFSRSFRNWVLNQDTGEKAFWDNWVARNPDKTEMVRQARALIFALHRGRDTPGDNEVGAEVKKALARLRDAPRYLPAGSTERRRLGVRLRYPMLAATAILVIGIGMAAFLFFRAHAHWNVLRSFLHAHRDECLQFTAGDEGETFRLPDSSLVRLGRNSTLYYPSNWRNDRDSREIYLEGDAYLDIRRDAVAPFYIYTGQLVTRVLGTRLLVRDRRSGLRAAVTVMAGKVSVYRADDFYDHSPGTEPGAILTRNQEVVDDIRKDRLEKMVAPEPQLSADQPDTGLLFRGVPARKAFSRLQDLYGIPIQFDEAAGDACSVTARLDGKSFYQQLNMICQAIGGSYVVTDGCIVVTVRGCR